jgi:hypothetical protein
MGNQERLGTGSRVRWLDAGVVRMVLEQVWARSHLGFTHENAVQQQSGVEVRPQPPPQRVSALKNLSQR